MGGIVAQFPGNSHGKMGFFSQSRIPRMELWKSLGTWGFYSLQSQGNPQEFWDLILRSPKEFLATLGFIPWIPE